MGQLLAPPAAPPKGSSGSGVYTTAKEYERTRERGYFWVNEDSAVKEFLSDLIMAYPFSDRKYRVLLDVPMGTGSFVNIYQKLGFEFHGIEISEEMLEQAKLKQKGKEFNNSFKIGDARRLDVPDDRFPLVVSTRFLLSIISYKDTRSCLAEISRVCSFAAILELNWGDGRIMDENSNMRCGLTYQQLNKLIKDYSFIVVKKRIVKETDEGKWALFLLQKNNE